MITKGEIFEKNFLVSSFAILILEFAWKMRFHQGSGQVEVCCNI
jgi:hypothetical protein